MARILVIDDNSALCAVVCDVLQQAGHEALALESGRKAAHAHRAHPVDLLITDIFMPETDGLELISEFQRNFPEVKIIAVSGGGTLGMVELLTVAQRMGAQRVLLKPFDIQELLATVDSLLDDSGETE